MTRDFIYQFIKERNLAVVSTTNSAHNPEAALVGFAVSEHLEIIFDTVKTSRKYKNLLNNPYAAVVIGWENETTLQYEGKAAVLTGEEGDRLKEIYFDVFNDGRHRAETWADIVHFKITPTWVRYSNFNGPVIVEEMVF